MLQYLCSKNKIHNILLLIYVYSFYIRDIMNYIFGLPTVAYYVSLITIVFTVLIIDRKLSKKVIFFELFFIIIVLINALIVDYQYYVLVEGIQAFLCVSIPILIISGKNFKLNTFILFWYKFYKYSFFIVLTTLILFIKDIFNYGVFNFIILPNIVGFALYLLTKRNSDLFDYIILMLNLSIILFCGGRVSALTCFFIMYFSLFYVHDASIRTIMVLAPLLFSIYSYFNISQIITFLIDISISYNIHSRNLNLLLNNVDTGTLYLTGRDSIYLLCYEKIIENGYFPGGFGVVLHMTDGKYYYAHNILLQMFLTFGYVVSLFVSILIIIKFYRLIRIRSNNVKIFTLLLFISYFMIGLTGSSFWIHPFSTILISMLFFYKCEEA